MAIVRVSRKAIMEGRTIDRRRRKALARYLKKQLELEQTSRSSSTSSSASDLYSASFKTSPSIFPLRYYTADPLAAAVSRLSPSSSTSSSDSSAGQCYQPQDYRIALQNLLSSPVVFVPGKITNWCEQKSVALRNRREKKGVRQTRRNDVLVRLSRNWPGTHRGPTGLFNPLNFCYRRSVLQSLLNVPTLVNWLQLHRSSRACSQNPKHQCLACAFKTFSQQFWNGPRSSPQLLVHAVKALDRAISRNTQTAMFLTKFNGQQDACDFVQYLLSAVKAKALTTLEAPQDDPMLGGAATPPAPRFDQESFSALFETRKLPEWECGDCGAKHLSPSTEDAIWGLTLPNQKAPIGLNTLIRDDLRQIGLQIECDVCKTNNNRDRYTTIAAAPQVLTFQLRRFAFNANGQPKKVRTPVVFPLNLNISRHHIDSETQLRYNLRAVVLHSGGLEGGHYVAKVEALDGTFLCDDDDISAINPADLNTPLDGTFTPYLLTYLRNYP